MSLTRFISLCLLIPALYSFGFGQSPLDPDFQFWNDNNVVIPIYKGSSASNGKKIDRLSLLISQTNRIGTNQLHSADERIGFGFDVFVNKHLSISPTYVFRATHLLPVHWLYEQRLRLEGTFSTDWGPVGIKNRNRIERLIRSSRSDLTRYRNRTLIRFPLNPNGEHRIDGFVSAEPYFEFNRGLWTILDVGGGITTKLTHNLSTEIYYIHRGNLRDHVPNINAIGFNLKLSLD